LNSFPHGKPCGIFLLKRVCCKEKSCKNIDTSSFFCDNKSDWYRVLFAASGRSRSKRAALFLPASIRTEQMVFIRRNFFD